MGSRGPHQTDVVVGRNIRIRRLERKMSQTELGDSLGITFQQVQKYEKGVNRVGASRLIQIAGALGVPIDSLFEGAGPEAADKSDSPLELMSDPQALRLAQAFAGIGDSKVRRSIVNLVEKIVGYPRRSGGSGDGQ